MADLFAASILLGKKISSTIHDERLDSLECLKKVKEYSISNAEKTTYTADVLCFRYVNKISDEIRNELNTVLEMPQQFYQDYFLLAIELYDSLRILRKSREFGVVDDIIEIGNVRLYAMYELLGIKERNSQTLPAEKNEVCLLNLLKSGTSTPNGKTWADFEINAKSLLDQGRQVAKETETFIAKIEKFREKLLTS